MSTYTWHKEVLSLWDSRVASLSTPPLAVKTNFFRLLAVAQSVWIWLRDSLINIGKAEKNSTMKMIIEDMIVQVWEGKNLATIMEKHTYIFSANDTELVRAAQSMGNMPTVLREIANDLESQKKINNKIKWALMYPATLIIFTIAAVIILLIKVMPTIVSLFPNQESLPSITQYMLSVSAWMQEWRFALGAWIVSSIVTYNILYIYFLPRKIFIDGSLVGNHPIWDVVKTFYMFKFSKILWDFLKAWVDPIHSLEQMSKIFNNYMYKKKTEDIKNDLSAWFTFAEAIEESPLFDPILTQIIIVWEQTWNLWDILVTMAWFYKDDLMQKIDTAMGFIEPILMCMVAWVIWCIVASIFLPLADLVNIVGA